MLTLLTIWLCLWLVFFGWGKLACRLGRCDRDDLSALAVAPWIGVGMVVGLLQLWHLLRPVDHWAFAVTSIVGIASALLFGRRSLAAIPAMLRAHSRPFLVGALVVAWLVNRSLGTQDFYDHGMYYLNAIRWNSDYAIVPGLANLHSRLGFNNSNFLLHAMLELGSWRGYSGHIVNGLLAAMTVPIVVPGVRDVVYHRGRARQLGWFTVGLGMIVAISVVDRRISSANPEFPAGLLATVAAWRLLAISLFVSEAEGRALRWNLLAIAVLATTAVTFKTSVIFFAGLASLALVACLYLLARGRDRQPLWSTAKLVAFMAPWVLSIFVPWIARGYVLSGYPLFPATFGRAPVDWAYPPALAATLRQDIYAFARAQYDDIDLAYKEGWHWVPRWLVRVMLIRAPVEVAAVAAIALACLAWMARSRERLGYDQEESAGSDLASWLLAGCYAGSLIAWFLTAPAARMATFAWWGLVGTLLGLASRSVPQAVFERRRQFVLAGLLIMFLLPMVEQAGLVEFRYRTKHPNRPEYSHHFYEYFPLVLPQSTEKFPPLRTGKLELRTNHLGLTMYVSVPQPDGWPSLPWDSPLPTARYLNSHLKLRHSGDMQDGFVMVPPQTGGAWPPRRP